LDDPLSENYRVWNEPNLPSSNFQCAVKTATYITINDGVGSVYPASASGLNVGDSASISIKMSEDGCVNYSLKKLVPGRAELINTFISDRSKLVFLKLFIYNLDSNVGWIMSDEAGFEQFKTSLLMRRYYKSDFEAIYTERPSALSQSSMVKVITMDCRSSGDDFSRFLEFRKNE
jgi:hypothetical protein